MITTSTYLLCFLSGILGLLFHIFAIKIPGIKARATVANVPFSLIQYLKDDSAAIFASLVSILLFIVILDEAIAFKPEVLPYIKVGFAFVGFTGSSVLIAVFGTAQTKLNKIIDVKTGPPDTPDTTNKTV